MVKASWWLFVGAVFFLTINSSSSLQCFLNEYTLDEEVQVPHIGEVMLKQMQDTTYSDFPTNNNVAIRIQNDYAGPSLLPFLLKAYNRTTNLRVCAEYGTRNIFQIEFNEQCYYNCDIKWYGNCLNSDRLFFLEISFCKLEHILKNSFTFTPSLETLNLTNNAISTIERGAFDNQNCLKVVDLSYNRLVSIANITLSSTLTELRVNDNQLPEIEWILLRNISKIYLNSNRLSGNVYFDFFDYFHLTEMNLSNNTIYKFVWSNSRARNLVRLSLAHNGLEIFIFGAEECKKKNTDNTLLKACDPAYYQINLQDLNLSHNNLKRLNITDVGIVTLDLSFNKFKITADFITGLPVTIQTLNLSSNNEIQMISRMFAKHFNLTNLSLEYLNISDLPKNVFYNLTQLKTLSLAHNRLTKFSFSLLSTVTNLTFLDLSFNQLKHFDSKSVFTFVHLNLNVDHNPWTCEIIRRLRIDLKFDNIFIESGNSTLTASNHVNGIECEDDKYSIGNLASTIDLQLRDYMREINETIFTENKKLHDIINSKTNDSKSLEEKLTNEKLEVEEKLLALQKNVSLEIQRLLVNKSSGDDDEAFLKFNSSIIESLENIIKQKYIPSNATLVSELAKEMEYLRNNFTHFKNHENRYFNQTNQNCSKVNENSHSFLRTKLSPEHTEWPLILAIFVVGIAVILSFLLLNKYQMKKIKQSVNVEEIMLK